MKWLRRILIVLLVLVAAGAIAYFVENEPRPTGVSGEEADALARKLQAAVNLDAFKKLGAVSFQFDGHRHLLWDRTKNRVRIDWKTNRAFLDVGTQTGRVFKKNVEIVDVADRTAFLADALAYFYNDTFWVSPFMSFFDPGVTRSITPDGGLLIAYASGGKTPGDAYVWYVDETGLPTRVKMWVKILPLGGVNVTWTKWQDIEGAKISAEHVLLTHKLELRDLRGGATPSDIEKGAPFDLLDGGAAPATQPAE